MDMDSDLSDNSLIYYYLICLTTTLAVLSLIGPQSSEFFVKIYLFFLNISLLIRLHDFRV